MKRGEDFYAAVTDLFQKVIDENIIFAISPLRLDQNQKSLFLFISSFYLSLNKFEENLDLVDLNKLVDRFKQFE
jgi:hypothetical protein